MSPRLPVPRVLLWMIPILALLLGIASAYFFLTIVPQPEPMAQRTGAKSDGKAAVTDAPAGPAGSPGQPVADAVENARHEAMRVAYAALEQERRELADRLGLLKTQLWQVKLRPDQSATLTRVMMQGHALLKDPPLLGAFTGAVEIEQERARLRAVQSGLDELRPVIEAARAAAGESAGS